MPVGSIDLPRAQHQEPLLLDFSGIGGHLALGGAPQSGKSTFLRSLITAFVLSHDPSQVQFYCVDLGGGQLRPLEAAPHVGAVAGKAERERILQTIQHVASLIDEREVLFREHGLDGVGSYRRLRAAGRVALLPNLFAGFMLLVAMRLILGGAALPWVGLALLAAGAAHVADLRSRL